MLSYHKAVKFRLVDARNAANNAIVAVRKGSKPAENASYTNLPLDFTVNLDNGKYYFKGLSTTAGSYAAFDPSADTVNADQTVYAYYEVDPAWTAARAALDASRAIGAATLPNVQDPALQAALNNAAAVSNAVAPSSSIAAMQAAMVALNQQSVTRRQHRPRRLLLHPRRHRPPRDPGRRRQRRRRRRRRRRLVEFGIIKDMNFFIGVIFWQAIF